MQHSELMLMILLALSLWSFVVICLFKLPRNFEATPITIDSDLQQYGVMIDNREGIDDESLMDDIKDLLPSLPIANWQKYQNLSPINASKCAEYPSIFDLDFNNIYWQTLQTTNGIFQLFGAYYDIRKNSAIGPAVRILGMIDRLEPKVKTFCQFWFDGQKQPLIVRTFEYRYIWDNRWTNYTKRGYRPYLIACPLPEPFHGIVPASVSIVEEKCDTATNNLRVIYNRPPDDKKKGFAVCVKGLDFQYEDLSVRLIEWIELLNILGAEKIYFYKFNVHPNITKVLQYYEREGKVQVSGVTLAGGQPNAPGFQHLYLNKNFYHRRFHEVIAYNDCLYKNMYSYEFLTLLDIDEVIIPKHDTTWAKLMERIKSKASTIEAKTFSSYNVRNVYFLDEYQSKRGWYQHIPKYLHMLQHIHRAQNFTRENSQVKCFHDPEHVITLHNHFPVNCFGGKCQSYSISTEDAQLHHYRTYCKKLFAIHCDYFKEYVRDTTIWKFKAELIKRSEKALKSLGFFRNLSKKTHF